LPDLLASFVCFALTPDGATNDLMITAFFMSPYTRVGEIREIIDLMLFASGAHVQAVTRIVYNGDM
jgi:hypothetical protein